MHHDLVSSPFDLDLRSKNEVDFRGHRIYSSIRFDETNTMVPRVVVIFEVRNFLAPNSGICKVPGGNPLGKIIYELVNIYPVLNDLEVSRNVI